MKSTVVSNYNQKIIAGERRQGFWTKVLNKVYIFYQNRKDTLYPRVQELEGLPLVFNAFMTEHPEIVVLTAEISEPIKEMLL